MPGMDKVDSPAEFLVDLRHEPSLTLTNQQAGRIVNLWLNLLPYDQQRVAFAARYQERLNQRRFHSPKKKKDFTPGVPLCSGLPTPAFPYASCFYPPSEPSHRHCFPFHLLPLCIPDLLLSHNSPHLVHRNPPPRPSLINEQWR
ncbi:hypothetical protein AALO_G00133250 [Alosa alosa]|uniref:Uncharacterized protein n=1 Tax=Alosa alosa TaxID=278164 RepID=A0AAV6GGB1_9TELE|nr:hypothetical protein AALO_G00133250 [Alosa alosa]